MVSIRRSDKDATGLIDKLSLIDLAFCDNDFKRTDLLLVILARALSIFVVQKGTRALRNTATALIESGILSRKQSIPVITATVGFPTANLMVKLVSNRIKITQATAENASGTFMTGTDEISSGLLAVKISGQDSS